MDAPHYTHPDPLLAVKSLIKDATPEEAALLGALAASAVSQALALRRLPVATAANDAPQYVPHPLDVLIFAVLDQEGAKQQADMLAALSGDTYVVAGADRKVTATSLKNRLPELVRMKAIAKTAAGYVVMDRDAVDLADSAF